MILNHLQNNVELKKYIKDGISKLEVKKKLFFKYQRNELYERSSSLNHP